MPDRPTQQLVDDSGQLREVPADQVSASIAAGWHAPTAADTSRLSSEAAHEQDYGGIGGAAKAIGYGAARGLTLGASDVAFRALGASPEHLRGLQEENPVLSTGSEIAGNLLPALFAPESLIGKAPAAKVTNLGRAIMDAGEGAGAIAKAGYATAGAGAEGALYGGGQYLSQVALENKPLSAEGFVASMGNGALFAAPVGGALSLGGSALQRARSLFPAQQVTQEAAKAVDSQAASAVSQAVADGEQMASALRKRIALTETKMGMAEAGEQTIRRMFGDADLAALNDQAVGGAERVKMADALQRYEASKVQLSDWIREEANPDLEAALTGLQAKGVQTPARGAVPVGEFGAPGSGGFKSQGELARLAGGNDASRQAATPLEPVYATRQLRGGAKGTPVSAAKGGAKGEPQSGSILVERVGRPSKPTFEVSLPDGAKTQLGRDEVGAWVDAQMPDGFSKGSQLEIHRSFSIERGIPADVAGIKDNALYIVRPSELAEHGVWGNEIHPQHFDSVKAARRTDIRLPPIDIDVTPDGRFYIEDGNHRVAVAALSDAPMAVNLRKVDPASGWKPQVHAMDVTDRLRTARVTSGDNLEALLSATKARLDSGEGINEIGAPVRAEYAASKAEASKAAAEHFRARAKGEVPSGLEDIARIQREIAGEQTVVRRPGGADVTGSDAFIADALRRHGIEPSPGALADLDALLAAGPRAPERTSVLGRRILAEHGGAPVSSAEYSARAALGRPLAERPPRPIMIDPEDANESIAAALGRRVGRNVDMGASITKAAKAIGDYEAATADLVEILGPQAPPAAAENAKAYRAATAGQAEAAAASSARAAEDLATKPGVQGALGKAADLGGALEILRALGVHTPNLSAIPVIGPVLSLFLRAKAVMGIIGRKGGSVGRSTESVVAAKAAEVRNRINSAAIAALSGASKGARKAAPWAAGPTITLAGKLFPGGSDPKSKDPRVLYQARADELARAMAPGAIDHAVGDRIQSSDPALQAAIVSQVQRGLQFLSDKMPKQTVLPGMLPGDGKWQPSKAALEEWGKYVHAVNDPASVLEGLAKGHVSIEGAETLRVVYPQLYAEAQRILLEHAAEFQETLPYPRRVAISIMYQVPVDGTMTPHHMQFLQQANQTAAASPSGPLQTSGPGITGPLSIGQQTMTSLDRRAGA